MNYTDILFLFIVLLAALGGWHKGFMISVLELFSWVATLVITYFLYPHIADLFEKLFPAAGIWVSVVSILFILFTLGALFSLLTGTIIRAIPENYHHHIINKISGIFPGLISGCLFFLILIALLFTVPVYGFDNPSKGILLNELTPKIQWIGRNASRIFGKEIIWPRNMLTVDPASEKSIKLGFSVTHVKVREDLELKMLHLVNMERKKVGIDTLRADPELTALARRYSEEMFAEGYFSHFSPDGKSPFDRMKEAKIKFRAAGENLALAPTLPIAHTGLMNSPGHKANILRPAFGRLGIGIVEGGRHGLMITQEFRN
jgi:uncharacterized protein YkwD/uncharacterized membrane protein required for colicin V production